MSTPVVPAIGALEAVGVSMTYGQGDTFAVSGAHFAVHPGETVAITGPSGCGKSSLLYCLGGVLKPTAGQVLLDGTDVATLGDAELSDLRARALGFVFQFGELVPELTLAENIGLPLMIAGERRKRIAPRVQEALERLEIAKLGDRRPAQVSGGQAQRVAVARALIHRPRYLLADEPTGSLDRRSGTLVLDAMLGMARDQGTGVVIVTHDLEVAQKADRVIAMTDGMITAEAVEAAGAEDRSASRA